MFEWSSSGIRYVKETFSGKESSMENYLLNNFDSGRLKRAVAAVVSLRLSRGALMALIKFVL